MLSAQADSVQSETQSQEELQDAMRVLGAVVEQLAERVELLEARENVRIAAALL